MKSIDNRGVTLVELLVAFVLLVTVTTVFASMVFSGAGVSVTHDVRLESLREGQNWLEESKHQLQRGEEPAGGKENLSLKGIEATMEKNIAEVHPGLYELKVSIKATEGTLAKNPIVVGTRVFAID
ncbi:Tfp pilus assembly protein PilE [Desulfitispora alkaliphila]|uniref:type IV pilus modification PilV family protein n=1 Tax=Desulfitispora alkaliphila TaxID=622674 RepID=UPI003D1A9293